VGGAAHRARHAAHKNIRRALFYAMRRECVERHAICFPTVSSAIDFRRVGERSSTGTLRRRIFAIRPTTENNDSLLDHPMKSILLTSASLEALLSAPFEFSASIYLPTARTGDDLRQAPIRLKTHIASIETRLDDQGMRAPDARRFTAPLRELIDDELFWQEQTGGVALFLSSQGLRCVRLRSSPNAGLWMGHRFYIMPLLAMEERTDPYRVLAVSANSVKLYAGTRDGLQEISSDDLPHGLKEALNLDQPTALVQVMTTPVGTTFHGQGGEVDRRKGELHDYFRIIDRALHSQLGGSTEPLLFAGVGYLFPIYHEVNTHPQLLETSLAGNPEDWDVAELHRRAEAILEPYRRRGLEHDIAQFERLVGAQRTADLLTDVLTAAHEGAIESLFVASGQSFWGRYEADVGWLDMTYRGDPAGEDLLDLAAYQTLKHGGRVHLLPAAEVPHGVIAAAHLRYARASYIDG